MTAKTATLPVISGFDLCLPGPENAHFQKYPFLAIGFFACFKRGKEGLKRDQTMHCVRLFLPWLLLGGVRGVFIRLVHITSCEFTYYIVKEKSLLVCLLP